LSRIGRFYILRGVYSEILIVRSVYAEVVERGWGLAGSLETEKAVQEGWIKVLDVVDKRKAMDMALTRGIHPANTETVQLAQEVKATTLLANEEEVRELASRLGVEVKGCLGLLIEGVKRKLITVREAEESAQRLIEDGYRVSREVLKEFHALLHLEGRG
jgi:predicted nucleic acid-binding protein